MVPRRPRILPLARVAAVAMLFAAAGACSSDDDGVATDDVADSSPVATVTTVPTTAATGEPTTAAAVATEPAPPTTVVAPPGESTTVAESVTTPAPIAVPVTDPPVTGLPGATSTDAFCTTYGPLVLSVYLVGLSEAFAADPFEPRRVELVAGSTIDYAYRSSLELLPAELAADTDAFVARWQPYADRAVLALDTVARSALAGELFPERLTIVLSTHDRNDPVIDLGLDESAASTLEALVPDFASQAGAISDDLAVARGASAVTPLIDAHVARACPDLATLTAADAV